MFFVRFARVCSRHEQARTPSDDESSENFPRAVVPVVFPFSAFTRRLPLDRSRVGARGLLARNRSGLLLILFLAGCVGGFGYLLVIIPCALVLCVALFR